MISILTIKRILFTVTLPEKKPMKLFYPLVFYLVWTMGCASGQKKEVQEEVYFSEISEIDGLEEILIGKWINSSFEVNVQSYNNGDTSFLVEIPEALWSEMMELKPFEATLKADGTYDGEQWDYEGNLVQQPTGIWFVDGDTLYLESSKGHVTKYHVLVLNDELIFTALIDYDEDGVVDDLYSGKQKRLKKEE